MMKVEGSPASEATEHHISDIVDERWINANNGVLAVILFTFFLLLKHGLPFPERRTRCAFFMTILTPGETGCDAFLVRFSEIFLMRHVDTTAALQDEVAFTNFRDKMFPAIPRSNAGFMIRETAALAVDEGA